MRTKRSPKKDRNSDASSSKQEQINQLERELDMERQYQGLYTILPVKFKNYLFFSAFHLDYNKQTSNFSSAYERHSPAINSRNSDEESLSKRHFKQQMESQPITRKHVSDNQVASILDRRHLEDVTNHHPSSSQQLTSTDIRPNESRTLIIDDQLKNLDPVNIWRFFFFVRQLT